MCRQVRHQHDHRCQRGQDTRAGNKTQVVSKPESYNVVKENKYYTNTMDNLEFS